MQALFQHAVLHYLHVVDALLGADVVLTDVKAVLPLLKRNYETNLSPAALRGMMLSALAAVTPS